MNTQPANVNTYGSAQHGYGYGYGGGHGGYGYGGKVRRGHFWAAAGEPRKALPPPKIFVLNTR